MKKKLLSCLLVLSIALTMIPFASFNSYAASSSGPKTFVKTKTVTIKPGKTYKMPKFKLTKKMALQVPLEIWLADSKEPDYIKNGSFVLTLKNAKGKKVASYEDSLEYVESKKGEYYDGFVYYYHTISKPCFSKGKYYFTIKNTTKRTIKVKFSVRGYTKFATKTDFPKSKTIDCSTMKFHYIGKISSGLPAVKSIKSSNDYFGIAWKITKDGKLYVMPWEAEDGDKTTLTITLMNGKKTKVTLKAKY